MNPQLSDTLRKTSERIFPRPAAQNLDRRDVLVKSGDVAEVVEEPNGNLNVTRNGQTLVLHASPDNNGSDPDQLTAIRHFVEGSDVTSPQSESRSGPEPVSPTRTSSNQDQAVHL